jgi:GxxExxY protein
VIFKGHSIDCGFRTDVIVDDLVLVELKAVEEMKPVYTSQVLTYLRLTSIQLGFLINFNVIHLKDGIRRFVRPDLLRDPNR